MDLSVLSVTPTKAKQFAVRGIYTVEDLLGYWPKAYRDMTQITGLRPDLERSTVLATVDSVRFYPGGRGKVDLILAVCQEIQGGQRFTVKWFRQRWRYEQIYRMMGQTVFVAGAVTMEGTRKKPMPSMTMPDVFDLDLTGARKVYPVYKKVPGMALDYLTEKMNMAMTLISGIEESLPEDILKREGLLPMQQTVRIMHQPKDMDEIEDARKRIVFDELLYYAMENERAKVAGAANSPFKVTTTRITDLIEQKLPFSLTMDQRRTVDQLIATASAGKRINALIQGDVGCGKTITAVLVAAALAGSGCQVAVMAPTQVLAKQHYEDLKELFQGTGINVAFLGGKMSKKERGITLGAIADGRVQIVVGTHAVISDGTRFHRLALTIVDEEHRFGVAQREAIVAKAAQGVHSITMSATPIPRSLATVIYGDNMELYTIHTMPAGRKPVKTGVTTDRQKIYKAILRHVSQGHQAYVVCPLIDQNEDMEGVESVEEVYAEYKKALEPQGVRIAVLTGRTKADESAATLEGFKNGDIDVLIATTVIEVGVNVPTATIMVVTNAERFGLSQLHQLRGRVGRGNSQAYCVLELGKTDATENAVKRLQAMCSTTDGFEIAQADLEQRGAGELLGLKQSGESKYVSLMLAYPEIYKRARVVAVELLEREAQQRKAKEGKALA